MFELNQKFPVQQAGLLPCLPVLLPFRWFFLHFVQVVTEVWQAFMSSLTFRGSLTWDQSCLPAEVLCPRLPHCFQYGKLQLDSSCSQGCYWLTVHSYSGVQQSILPKHLHQNTVFHVLKKSGLLVTHHTVLSVDTGMAKSSMRIKKNLRYFFQLFKIFVHSLSLIRHHHDTPLFWLPLWPWPTSSQWACNPYPWTWPLFLLSYPSHF